MAEFTNYHSPPRRCQENKWLLCVMSSSATRFYALRFLLARQCWIIFLSESLWYDVRFTGQGSVFEGLKLFCTPGMDPSWMVLPFDAPLYVVSMNIVRSSNQFMLLSFWIYRESLDFIINFCSLIHAYTTWSQMCRFWSILWSGIYMWIWLIEQVKNFILFGDIHKSIYFLCWKDDGAIYSFELIY
jgi:hypothetical protein